MNNTAVCWGNVELLQSVSYDKKGSIYESSKSLKSSMLFYGGGLLIMSLIYNMEGLIMNTIH